MLRTKVKASSITNLTDARYFAAKGVDWISFDVNPNSDNYIETSLVVDIGEWVAGVDFLMEYGDMLPETIITSTETLLPQYIQVGRFMEMDDIFKLHPSISTYKEIIIQPEMTVKGLTELFEEYETSVVGFILNFDKNNISWKQLLDNKPFSITYLKEIIEKYAIILEINFSPDTLKQCLGTLAPYGISLKGGSEEKTGLKSYEELDELFDVLEDVI